MVSAMQTTPVPLEQESAARRRSQVDVVVPVYNEEDDLERSVRRLHEYLTSRLPFSARITIADNASTDATAEIADRLSDELPDVRVIHLAEKGRGRALRAAWSGSDAQVLAYMDVDLSTHLDGLLPLVAPLLSGHSDISIGSRLARGSNVVRGPKREVISRAYNVVLHATLGARFSDAQCGFKAIRADRARELLPLVEDQGWFFDTELLIVAERSGLRIHEVPVDWVDDPDSRVDIAATAIADLRGIARLARGLWTGSLPLATIDPRRPVETVDEQIGLGRQLLRFGAIGLASTAFFGVLYLMLRGPFGAQAANALALLVATFANTAANRRITFGVRGRSGVARHQLQGLAILGIALVLTSGSLAVLHAAAPDAGHGAELAVLTIANIAATLVRFLLFRAWVFARRATVRPRLDGATE
jgi:putative flippase GtrA